jgi:hypothetical protein
MEKPTEVHVIADEISVWIDDGGAIIIKTHEPHGDPVELAEHEAPELAALLTRLVEQLRGTGAPS